jgi:hypothetical protein
VTHLPWEQVYAGSSPATLTKGSPPGRRLVLHTDRDVFNSRALHFGVVVQREDTALAVRGSGFNSPSVHSLRDAQGAGRPPNPASQGSSPWSRAEGELAVQQRALNPRDTTVWRSTRPPSSGR